MQLMREKRSPLTLKKELTITYQHNSGDISGILCSYQNGDKGDVVCVLSHLLFPKDFILY